VFTPVPYVPTLEGQYIIKNLVTISAGSVVGATERGGEWYQNRRERITSEGLAEPSVNRSLLSASRHPIENGRKSGLQDELSMRR
jgi:hypothetical protein